MLLAIAIYKVLCLRYRKNLVKIYTKVTYTKIVIIAIQKSNHKLANMDWTSPSWLLLSDNSPKQPLMSPKQPLIFRRLDMTELVVLLDPIVLLLSSRALLELFASSSFFLRLLRGEFFMNRLRLYSLNEFAIFLRIVTRSWMTTYAFRDLLKSKNRPPRSTVICKRIFHVMDTFSRALERASCSSCIASIRLA